VPCREGVKRMHEILTDIVGARGKEGDVERLEALARVVQASSLCGLGKTAPNPLLTTIKYFRDEYVSHVKYKRCPDVPILRELAAPRGLAEPSCIAEAEICFLCGICVRACRGMVGAEAIGFAERGAASQVVPPFARPSTRCIGCGTCTTVRPARTFELSTVEASPSMHGDATDVRARTRGRLVKETVSQAGVNPNRVVLVNVREHCARVHVRRPAR